MALLDNTKLDKLFKALMNRAMTSVNKAFYEENIPTVADIHANDIYLNPIPTAPPVSNTTVVKVHKGLVLTKDQSVDGNKAWVVLPQWTNVWSSGSDDVSQIMKNFISPKYGKGYVVKVYKGDGSVIPELSSLDWTFDYKAGVLTFEDDPAQNGSTVGTSIKIDVYQYVGQTVADNVAAGTEMSSLNDVDETAKVDGSILMYNQAEGKWKPVSLTSQPALFDIQDINTDGIRAVTVPQSYEVGANELMVFYNGQLVNPGREYQEVDSTHIEFNFDLYIGDQITLRMAAAGYKA